MELGYASNHRFAEYSDNAREVASTRQIPILRLTTSRRRGLPVFV